VLDPIEFDCSVWAAPQNDVNFRLNEMIVTPSGACDVRQVDCCRQIDPIPERPAGLSAGTVHRSQCIELQDHRRTVHFGLSSVSAKNSLGVKRNDQQGFS
jgi:hypothetical protein